MDFNKNYKKKRKPTCRLCRRRLTVCNKDSHMERRRKYSICLAHSHKISSFDHRQHVPQITAYFPYCSNFDCNQFSNEFNSRLEQLMRLAVEDWDVPKSGKYYLDVGVAIGKSVSAEEALHDRVWRGGPVLVPARMNRLDYGRLHDEMSEMIAQSVTDLKQLVLSILDDSPYLSNINCISLECHSILA